MPRSTVFQLTAALLACAAPARLQADAPLATPPHPPPSPHSTPLELLLRQAELLLQDSPVSPLVAAAVGVPDGGNLSGCAAEWSAEFSAVLAVPEGAAAVDGTASLSGCELLNESFAVSLPDSAVCREAGGSAAITPCEPSDSACACSAMWEMDGDTYSGCAVTTAELQRALLPGANLSAVCGVSDPLACTSAADAVRQCGTVSSLRVVLPGTPATPCLPSWEDSVSYALRTPHGVVELRGTAAVSGCERLSSAFGAAGSQGVTAGGGGAVCGIAGGGVSACVPQDPACACRTAWEYEGNIEAGCAVPTSVLQRVAAMGAAGDVSVHAVCAVVDAVACRDAVRVCATVGFTQVNAVTFTPTVWTSTLGSATPTETATATREADHPTATATLSANVTAAPARCDAEWTTRYSASLTYVGTPVTVEGVATVFGCERLDAAFPDTPGTPACSQGGGVAACSPEEPACACKQVWDAGGGVQLSGCAVHPKDLQDVVGGAVRLGGTISAVCATADPAGCKERRVCATVRVSGVSGLPTETLPLQEERGLPEEEGPIGTTMWIVLAAVAGCALLVGVAVACRLCCRAPQAPRSSVLVTFITDEEVLDPKDFLPEEEFDTYTKDMRAVNWEGTAMPSMNDDEGSNMSRMAWIRTFGTSIKRTLL